jgi:hypothetical protein
MLADQFEIRFVNQSSGLKGMVRPLAPHIPAGEPFELVIDQRNKLFLGSLVPIRYFDQQGRHVWFRNQATILQPVPGSKYSSYCNPDGRNSTCDSPSLHFLIFLVIPFSCGCRVCR